jgi:vitamin B12 transporter
MHHSNGAAVFGCLLLISTLAAAAEPEESSQVVVTATRASEGVRADLLGGSFTILEPQTLEARQTRVISDVLRDVPGVSVSRSGAVGGQTTVRMRGAEGNHTLVLIDGIEASDPFYGAFDFATLIADDLARVEVLRGPQSALYGSEAIGGVINYITLSGREAPGVRTRIEGGSFGTVDVSARAAGVAGAFDYAFSGGHQRTDGVPTSRFGSRDIGAENTALSGRFGYEASETLRFKAIARYSRTEGDSNDQDFDFPPGPSYGFVIDSDDTFETRAFYGLLRGELDTLEGRWTHALSAQTVDAKRDAFSGGSFANGDDGNRVRFSYESSLRFGTEFFRQTLTAAFDHEREEFQNRGAFLTEEQTLERDITNEGIVLQYDANVNERFGFGAAARHDDNDRFEDDESFRVQGSYRLESGTRLRAAAGSGIKNPDIFELFGFDPSSFVGNPNLKPEQSRGWEVGLDQRFGPRFEIGVTYFESKLRDEIATVFLPSFVFSVENLDTESTQEGIEIAAVAQVTDALRIDASYTYLDAEEDGREEIRRPPHTASLNIAWRAHEDRGGVALTVRYNGDTFDSDFTDPFDFDKRVRLSDYTLVNLGADWKLTANTQLYARVENLLDDDYEEVFTYRSPGIAAYAGARFTFR